MAAVQYTVANQPFLIVRQKSQIQFQTIKLSTTSCRVGCSRNQKNIHIGRGIFRFFGCKIFVRAIFSFFLTNVQLYLNRYHLSGSNHFACFSTREQLLGHSGIVSPRGQAPLLNTGVLKTPHFNSQSPATFKGQQAKILPSNHFLSVSSIVFSALWSCITESSSPISEHRGSQHTAFQFLESVYLQGVAAS